MTTRPDIYSPYPDKFQEADYQQTERERRREWPLLHGDGLVVKVTTPALDRLHKALCGGKKP